ncbi:MAG: cobalamin-binding protein [Thaumarchaeota archaeon]|nr:cobalamin-binding protein [Nitrososphaerota archaeon]
MVTRTKSIAVIITIIAASMAGLAYILSSTTPPIYGDYPLTFVDDSGRNVTIKAKPQRIVSLIPSSSEIIYAVGADRQLVGVDIYSAYPQELIKRVRSGNLTTVGSGVGPDLEKIVSLNPDVIFVNGPSHVGSKAVQRLSELGYTIVSLDAQNIDGVINNIELVGKITGDSDNARKLVSSLKDRIMKVESAVKNATKVRVYIENWQEPLFSVGPSAIQDELITRAGGINIFSDLPKKSAQVSSEAVISKNPDVIVLFHRLASLDQVKNRPGWGVIDAVKNNRVHYIDANEENIAPYGAPGPRIIDGLEKIATFIHPEPFKKLEGHNEASVLEILSFN